MWWTKSNKTVSKVLVAAGALTVALAMTACASANDGSPGTNGPMTTPMPSAGTPMPQATPTPMASETIVDIAVADGRFTTLVTALEAAGLAETLAGEGPFTVFAPTDDAFAALPEGALEGLLADTDALRDVLLYHVVGGLLPASEVVEADSVMTAQGSTASARVENGNVYIDNAQVVITDIYAANGIIHVIDAVILPPNNG